MHNRKDLVAATKKRLPGYRQTNQDAEQAFDAVVGALHELLRDREGVRIETLGTFAIVKRAARKGRNPQTGEAIAIPARHVVKFKPAPPLADTVARL